MKIAIWGSSSLGDVLYRTWRAAGHDVVHAEPRPVNVLAMRLRDVDALDASVSDALAGAIVLDASIAFDATDYALRSFLPVRHHGSAFWVASRLPGARVVKAFSTLHGELTVAMEDVAKGLRDPIGVLIASDDHEAAAVAARLASDAGMAPLPIGGLREAERLDGPNGIGFTLASVEQLRFLLGQVPTARVLRRTPRDVLVARTVALGYSRSELAAIFPEQDLELEAFGDAWRSQLAAWALPCPEALIALADASAETSIDIGGWQLRDPEQANASRCWFETHRATYPELGRYADMAALFDRDGDLLLLDRDGHVHHWPHDDWDGARIVADDFESLLAMFVAVVDPGFGPARTYAPRTG
jgi:predicted dinucleotide-binding enzyme